MKLPGNWNTVEAKEYGSFKTLEPGSYICRIRQAEERQSKSGRQMLVIFFDIDEGENKGFYLQKYDSYEGAGKKWAGVYYQLTDGNSLSFFKGVISAIEKSNQGFIFDGDEKALAGKVFGGVFGEEEYEKQDGTIGSVTKIRYITSTERVNQGKCKTPEKITLKPKVAQQPEQAFEHKGTDANAFSAFANESSFDEEDLPF